MEVSMIQEVALPGCEEDRARDRLRGRKEGRKEGRRKEGRESVGAILAIFWDLLYVWNLPWFPHTESANSFLLLCNIAAPS
jgi:hypothetical protein